MGRGIEGESGKSRRGTGSVRRAKRMGALQLSPSYRFVERDQEDDDNERGCTSYLV